MTVFPTAGESARPIRLPEYLRNWANESLHCKYGDEAMEHYALPMDDVENFDDLSAQKKYNAAIRQIAENAPVRICEYEEVSGAATLGMAIDHCVPVTYKGENVFGSISHLTINYERTLKYGINGYEREIDEKLKTAEGRHREVLLGMKNVIESMRVWHARYIEALKRGERGDRDATAVQILERVPFEPAASFHEALQSVWFVFSFVRLCGNWPGIGRLDVLLGDYLKKDLESGGITPDRARELLASFFIKGTEWIRSSGHWISGDAQHYQNIVLGGVDGDGNEVTNDVTYLILEIVEELPISDFPISVRVNKNSPDKLLGSMARVVRHGGGVVAMYDEDEIIKGFLSQGYDIREARCFANDGCWEVQIPGATCFEYNPFDGLKIFNRVIGADSDSDKAEIPEFNSIDELWSAFETSLREQIDFIYRYSVIENFGERGEKVLPKEPCSVIDLFEDGCIENAESYMQLGAKYTVRSPHLGGAPDVANSLLAINKLVFEERLITFKELVECLRNNWEGSEPLRLYAHGKITYYGNDDDEADEYMRRVVEIFCRAVDGIAAKHPDNPVKFIPGISTFGRQIEWAPSRGATAFGARRGDVLSGNGSPTPGTDFSGASAIVRSYCKSMPMLATCGSALDLKIFPESLKGENGIEALKALFRAVVTLGGSFVQIDTVDTETLRAAQKHPEDYKTLSVRVSGWNARFVTLNEEWQNMIIDRSCQGI